MKSERFRVYLAFIIVCTVWGSTWLAIKLGLETLPPFLGAGIRFVIASSVLFLIVRVRKVTVSWTPEARRVYLTLGFLSFSFPYALVYWGERFIPSGLASVLFALFPFWVALFSQRILRDEQLDLFKIAGMIAAFAGVVVIFSHDIALGSATALYGMLAVVVSTILQAFTLVIVKKYGQPLGPFAMNAVGMPIGAVTLLAISFLTERGAPVAFTPVAIGSIIYLALFGSILTFVSFWWLLKRVEAVYLSLTTFIEPVVAVLLGAIVLEESLAPGTSIGAALVLLGILIANGRSLYEKWRTVPEE